MWKMDLKDPIFEAGSTTQYCFSSLSYFWNIFHSYFSLVSLQWNYIIKVVNDTYSQQPKDYIYRVMNYITSESFHIALLHWQTRPWHVLSWQFSFQSHYFPNTYYSLPLHQQACTIISLNSGNNSCLCISSMEICFSLIQVKQTNS